MLCRLQCIKSDKKMKPKARRKAREFSLQAIYQWQLAAQPLDEITTQYCQSQEFNAKAVDCEYFQELVQGVIGQATQLDELITPWLDRSIEELDPIELAVLRLAIYELKYQLAVPYRVVINEAIELTKKFGTQEGFKYINGVLDKAAHQLRSAEI